MEQIFTIASVWLGVTVLSCVIAYHLRVPITLIEISVGVEATTAASPRAHGRFSIGWSVGGNVGRKLRVRTACSTSSRSGSLSAGGRVCGTVFGLSPGYRMRAARSRLRAVSSG